MTDMNHIASAPAGDGLEAAYRAGYRQACDDNGDRVDPDDLDEEVRLYCDSVARRHLAVAPALDGYERLIEDVQTLLTPPGNEWSGHEPTIQSVAWNLIERRMNEIHVAALARPRAAVREREAIARICYVPNRVALGPVEAAFRLAAKEPTSSTGRCVAAAYDRADAILALQSPPAKVEG